MLGSKTPPWIQLKAPLEPGKQDKLPAYNPMAIVPLVVAATSRDLQRERATAA